MGETGHQEELGFADGPRQFLAFGIGDDRIVFAMD
jgi:hypothetical protein